MVLNYTKETVAFPKLVTYPPVNALLHVNSRIPSLKACMFACFSGAASEKQPPTTDKREINTARNQYSVSRHFLSGKQASRAQPGIQAGSLI